MITSKSTSIVLFFLSVILSGCSQESPSAVREIPFPTDQNSMYPRLFTDNRGVVFMSWIEQDDNLTTLKYASLVDESWGEPKTISSDDNWFVNWADFPSIITQNGKPMASHWLHKIPGGTYAYEINMSVFDGNWSQPLIPHEDNTATEHGFVSMEPASDSTFMVVWLDGRNTAGRSMDEYADTSKAMTLRAALIHRSGKIINKYLLDSTVCDCCNTAIAKTDSGFIIAYRNRTHEEIRDIYTVTINEAGEITSPVSIHQDNWKINACPVNGPALAVKNDYVALAWFTGAEGNAMVNLAISNDLGKTYTDPILIDDKTNGRVDAEIAHGKIWISRLSAQEDDEVLKISAYTLKGEWVKDYIFDAITTDRGSGFPQISASQNGLIIAYTNNAGDKKSVHTKMIANY